MAESDQWRINNPLNEREMHGGFTLEYQYPSHSLDYNAIHTE